MRGRYPFFQKANKKYDGRNCLTDLRILLGIASWYEPTPRTRDSAIIGGGEIPTETRTNEWADLSRISGLLAHG